MDLYLRFPECEGIPHFKTRRDAVEALFPRNSVGVELGVMRGTNSQNILDAIHPKTLYLVDPWPNREDRHKNVENKFRANPAVRIIRMKADQASRLIGKLDWYEDDTSMGFECTYDVLLRYDGKLVVGGLAMIDYCDPDGITVTRDRHVAVRKFLYRHTHVCVGIVDSTSSIILKKTGVPLTDGTREEMYKRIPKGGVGLEIGVCTGSNALNLLETAEPTSLTLVDPWYYEWHAFNFEKKVFGGVNGTLPDPEAAEAVFRYATETVGKDPRVTIMRGTSSQMVPQIPDKSLDWVYIDGDHSYKGAWTDIEVVLPKLKDQCLVLGHDWSYLKFHGVVNAVERLLRENPEFQFVGLTRDRRTKTFMLKRG